MGVTACFIALPHIVLTYAVDLKGQLACWRQADALHVLVTRVHMAKHAQHEAASLATAGLGLSQQVAVPGCGARKQAGGVLVSDWVNAASCCLRVLKGGDEGRERELTL